MRPADERRTSLGKFSYALRPAKNIERKMLCEAFTFMGAIAPLRTYRYIGFGSIEFVDFALFHHRLGIRDMISVECVSDARERVQFNRPYSCIRTEWGTSTLVLPTLDWKKRTILWLDYDRPLDSEILDDVALAAANLASGSMLMVTVEADPKRVQGDTNIAEERLNILVQNVGRDRLPTVDLENGQRRPVKGADLAKWGLARVSRLIINNEIKKTLKDRNGPLSSRWRVSYEQLFNFHYADGAKMLTLGGILAHRDHQRRLPASSFNCLEFVRRDDEAYLIEAPVLTWRELRYLDNHLTPTGFQGQFHKWLPRRERERYRRVYRYHPTFAEVEA